MESMNFSQLAAVDIRYWRMANPEVCPNCGLRFADVPPEYNIYPHFIGACREKL